MCTRVLGLGCRVRVEGLLSGGLCRGFHRLRLSRKPTGEFKTMAHVWFLFGIAAVFGRRLYCTTQKELIGRSGYTSRILSARCLCVC